MKLSAKYIFLLLLLFVFACRNDAPQRQNVRLHSHIDTVSYSLGVTIGKTLKKEGFTRINPQVMMAAMEEVLHGTNPDSLQIHPDVAEDILKIYMYKEHKRMLPSENMAWKSFMDKNGRRPGVHVHSSGLQYEILRRGSGPTPGLTDNVVVHYKGYLPNGIVFDNNYTRTPAVFRVSSAIKGWRIALLMMHKGAKWRIYIPPYLGFGDKDLKNIPPNSVLIYEIELLDIKHIK